MLQTSVPVQCSVCSVAAQSFGVSLLLDSGITDNKIDLYDCLSDSQNFLLFVSILEGLTMGKCQDTLSLSQNCTVGLVGKAL